MKERKRNEEKSGHCVITIRTTMPVLVPKKTKDIKEKIGEKRTMEKWKKDQGEEKLNN